MISLGEELSFAKAHVGLDVKSSEKPKMPGSMAWVAEALRAEREAIMEEMTKRHNALLGELKLEAIAGPQEPQKILVADPAEHKTFGSTASLLVGTDDAQESCSPRYRSTMPEEGQPQAKVCMETDPCSSSISQSAASSLWRSEGIDSAKGLRYLVIRLRMAIFSSTAEVGVAVLIVLNSLVMAIEAQYLSFDTAHTLRLPDAVPADVEWPWGKQTLFALEISFGVLFALEVILKLVFAPSRFVKSLWNFFDTFIVAFWMLSLYGVAAFVNPMLLRLLRLARLVRLLRLVKTIQMFDVLHVLVSALKSSLSVLLWTMLLLVGIMLLSALVFNFILEGYITDESKPYDARKSVYERYGSFSRAFVTMFETTLGNWVVPLRLLHENVSEWFGPVFLFWLCIVNFAVVQVIRAVFMCETFKVANWDDDIMVMQKQRQINKQSADMHRFFEQADTSGDGFLSLNEFMEISKDPTIKVWLSAMELDVSNASHVYQLMGDPDGLLSPHELIQGVSRLKGTARSIDMIAVQTMCRRIEKQLMALDEELAKRSNRRSLTMRRRSVKRLGSM